MATSISLDLCDICEIRNRTNQAMKWCPECEEKLCEECYGHHSVSKILRTHDVIDIEQYKKLPTSILAVKNDCEQHNMKYSHLCRQHDQLCCPACISETGVHTKCTTLVLQDVTQKAKTSVLLQSIEDTLQNLKENLKTIICDRKSNLQKLEGNKEEILKDVKKMKEKIIQQLTDFEKKLSDELDKSIKKNTRIVKSEITSLEERFQQAETMVNELNAMKQYGSDLQVYIGSKATENEVNKLKNNLQKLVQNENMMQVAVTLKWNKNVNEIIEKIASMGTVCEDKSPIAVGLTPKKGTQVSVMSSTPPNITIEDIKITFKSQFQINEKEKNLYGCSVFRKNKTVFANCYYKRIILCNENGQQEKVILVSSGPRDVTTIDDNTVTVSTDEGVEVINVTTNTVEKINTGRCGGVEYYKGSLLCCVAKGVLSVDLSTGTVTTVVKDTVGGGWYYCTVYNDRIYTTRSDNNVNTVACYTMGGDKVWIYKDPSVVKGPHGIAVDNSSNVYIASYGNHSIVVLSPDGQRHRTLLTQKDGISKPWALHFDRSKNQLLVGNAKGPGLLFHIH